MTNAQSLVLFSGGQDSTVCLAWALSRFDHVETIGFDYGQRHAAELVARPRLLAGLKRDFPHWAARLGADHLISLNAPRAIGGSALTEAMAIEMGRDGLPNTFVPGRNLMFLTAAAALGYRRGVADLVGRHVRDRFLRLSRLPQRDDPGDGKGLVAGPGARGADSHAVDVHRQGRDLEARP